jgi:hypothetical protein
MGNANRPRLTRREREAQDERAHHQRWQRRYRERVAFRYSGALERGDFVAAAAALAEAELDPELARILSEIDAAYRAELDHHTIKQERYTMIAASDRRLSPSERGAGLRLTPAWLAAAAVLVFIFAALWTNGRGLLPNGDTGSGNSGNGAPSEGGLLSGASAQDATRTPVPTTTPSPVMPSGSEGMIAGDASMMFAPDFAMAQPGTFTVIDDTLSNLCVRTEAILDVYSRPGRDGTLVTALPPETAFKVVSYVANETDELWLNISVLIESAAIQGWVSGDVEVRFVTCTNMEMFSIIVPPIAVATVVPPAGMNDGAISDFFATATAIVAEATATAAGFMPPTATPVP